MIGYGASGTAAYSSANGTSVAVPHPSGITAGQMLLLFIGQKPSTANGGTVTTPSGWTLVGSHLGRGGYGSTLGADTGNLNVFIYTKVAAGTESGSLTVTVGTNNVCFGVMMRFTKTAANPDPWATTVFSTGSFEAAPANTNTSITTTTLDLQGGDMVVCLQAYATDTVPIWTSGATLTAGTTHFNPASVTSAATLTTNNGNDIGGVLYLPTKVGNGSGTPTIVFARSAVIGSTLTNLRGPFVAVRLRETPVTIPDAVNRVTATELVGSGRITAAPVQRVAAAELVGSRRITAAPVQRLRAVELVVARPYIANNCWVWDGTAEVPASMFVWDGAQEVPTTLEFT